MESLVPMKNSIVCRSMPSLDVDALNVEAHLCIPKLADKMTLLDVSDKFVVPKSRSGSFSMFQRFDKNMINKELYNAPNRQDVIPTEEQILGQCGSMQMAVSYDSTINILRVELIQASNLISKTDTSPNPYFKISLIPPSYCEQSQCYQTKTYANQRSPDLSEEFHFEIRDGSLDQHKIEISVYDHDQYYVDECIGRCTLSIGRIEFPEDPSIKTVFWAEIMSTNSEVANSAGDLLLSISFLSKAQRLIATVIKARNLPFSEEHPSEMLNPYVKLTLYCKKKRLKTKKTSTKRDTHFPVFNEALTFDLGPTTPLCDLSLDFSVFNEYSAFRSHKLISKLTLPLTKCKDLWRALIRGEDTKFKWYQLEKA
uniref:C2 domain-containing protein n=1 Tax=Romanomermis culicivorax TaxID=13658 RepID=A0A915KDW5_ROMCU